MSYHPMQSRQGEDTRLVITTSTGAPFLQYVVSDIIEPLFPGETSVFQIHTIRMLPNLPRCSMIAASSTKSRDTKANLIQSMTDFTILNYPPILGGCANDKIMSKIYIWIKRTNSPSPQFLPLFGGIMHILHILGGYWHILLFRMCKKWGDKSFISLARIINSSFLIIAHYLLV